ncbi:hypothetical protein GQ55_5G438400 [Panicum hallii var. hallii]|uniref:Reverse transcriptase zinc-binding domain-containing protein n=1 Tax=Panicum hallii var. hallii TaxID=1504633 RepID=A0A2T7DPL0_9POAL|nr:hypothetical protein GQ55_5G438400 [Panicum hallii var. hallii]
MPIYTLMADKLPPWVFREIGRSFLWMGTNASCRGKSAVAFPTCCRPTRFGGLGIIDLKLAGFSLRTRWLWFQRTDENRAWSALQLDFEPEVHAVFSASVTVSVGNGERTLFWSDNWINGRSVGQIAPNLVTMISKRTARQRTVAQAPSGHRWVRDISGGLSIPVLMEYIRLWGLLADFQLGTGRTGFISMALDCGWQLHGKGATRIWKSWAPPKVKFFTWLATKGKIWTADRRRRHGLDAHDTCWLCDQEPETCDHILVNCSYAKQLWWDALITLDCTCSFASQQLTLQDWWSHGRRLQAKERRKGFDTLFMLIIWLLWKERNARLFDQRSSSADQLLQLIKLEIRIWVEAGATN